ncbi:16S rRNA (guanine(1516)-N(2))-methyltransferase RsmJ [Salinisphaera aquimarina]
MLAAGAVTAALPGIEPIERPPATGFYLDARPQGLTLQHAETVDRDSGLCIDLLDGSIERRLAGGRKSPLARALGLKRRSRPTVLDTTCGLGRDSATLAALGCDVHALERHPVLFALLDDALMRARRADTPPAWLTHWQAFEHADAHAWLTPPPPRRFDIIYIDPMFAAARRKARPQKALAWLNELIGTDHDADALLALARGHALRQTVVKQHARSQPLAAPDRQVHGKAVRFDIYLAASPPAG